MCPKGQRLLGQLKIKAARHMPFKVVYKGVTFPVLSTVMLPSSLAAELNIPFRFSAKLYPFLSALSLSWFVSFMCSDLILPPLQI